MEGDVGWRLYTSSADRGCNMQFTPRGAELVRVDSGGFSPGSRPIAGAVMRKFNSRYADHFDRVCTLTGRSIQNKENDEFN